MINPEQLKMHLINEGEKILSEIESGVGDKLYLIRVGVRIYRYDGVHDWGNKTLIYESVNFKPNNFIRWKWYFRYLAALEQTKTPKQLIKTHFYSYVTPNKEEVILRVLKNKLTAAKRDRTKMQMQIQKGLEESSNILFMESDPRYISAMKKVEDKTILIDSLELEINSLTH